jgi:hypothetical protein
MQPYAACAGCAGTGAHDSPQHASRAIASRCRLQDRIDRNTHRPQASSRHRNRCALLVHRQILRNEVVSVGMRASAGTPRATGHHVALNSWENDDEDDQ